MTRSDEVRQILDYALDHHRALLNGEPFTGSPVPSAELQDAADTVARFFRLDGLAQDIADGGKVTTDLHTLVMVAWAGGFKAGGQYSVQRRPSCPCCRSHCAS